MQVLIISYETFRLHALRFSAPEACDLLICDEAHRLKSDQTLTSKVGPQLLLPVWQHGQSTAYACAINDSGKLLGLPASHQAFRSC